MTLKNKEKELDYLLKELISEKDEKINIPNNFDEKRKLLRILMNIRPPTYINEKYLKIQNKFLSEETLSKELVESNNILAIGEKGKNTKIALWQGDITCLKVDAIVNAANNRLLGCFIPLHNCIDNIIHSSAGLQLRNDCAEIMKNQGDYEEIGQAKITFGYNLPSKYVIHTVGPAISPGSKVNSEDCENLKNCYNSCLAIADEYNLKSIAFCCISTGVFNFPKYKAAKIAIFTVNEYFKNNENSNLEKVIFDVFTDEDYRIYRSLLY